MPDLPRIALIGPGAIGTTIAAVLCWFHCWQQEARDRVNVGKLPSVSSIYLTNSVKQMAFILTL